LYELVLLAQLPPLDGIAAAFIACISIRDHARDGLRGGVPTGGRGGFPRFC
jgi:hypothetical protein